jgi:Domain of unknown function (DUF697)
VGEANERPDDHLPWGRDNDPMPGRAASSYVRIPVEIATHGPPPDGEAGDPVADTALPPEGCPGDPVADPGPSVLPDAPNPSPEPRPASRRRPAREPARPAQEPRRIKPGPSALPGRPLSIVLPAMVILLGVFLASLVLATVAAMVLLPDSARIAAAAVAAMFLGLLAYPAARWALTLSGLRPLRFESFEGLTSIRSATIEAVQRRAEFQSLTMAGSNEGEQIRAREALVLHLVSHPLRYAGDDRVWQALDLSAETLDRLRRRRNALIGPGRTGAGGSARPDEWLRSYEQGFQALLDDTARRRVEEHAWRAFKATAASPNGVADAMVTLSSGSAMLEDLGQIYDLRMGRVGGAVLLARLLVDNDLAGRTDRPDPGREAVIERVDGEGGESDGLSPESRLRAVLERHPIPAVAAEIAALLDRGACTFGLRAESGLFHYFLMRRLGVRAIRLLQPMARD